MKAGQLSPHLWIWNCIQNEGRKNTYTMTKEISEFVYEKWSQLCQFCVNGSKDDSTGRVETA